MPGLEPIDHLDMLNSVLVQQSEWKLSGKVEMIGMMQDKVS